MTEAFKGVILFQLRVETAIAGDVSLRDSQNTPVYHHIMYNLAVQKIYQIIAPSTLIFVGLKADKKALKIVSHLLVSFSCFSSKMSPKMVPSWMYSQ